MKESTLKLSKNLPVIAQIVKEMITELTGEDIGFALVVFTEDRANYISDCKREEVQKQFKHLLQLWENGMQDIPAHEIN